MVFFVLTNVFGPFFHFRILLMELFPPQQNRIRTSEGQTRAENLAHLEKLKHQLLELEKQYEKSKPLVNLVDNMVKLGSLYRGGNHRYPSETTTLDRLEFNQRIQERRLMQEEQRQWERMSPNQTELQVRNSQKPLLIASHQLSFSIDKSSTAL